MNRQTEQIYKQIHRDRILFALFIVIAIFSLPFFFGRLNILNDAYSSRNWPSVSAKINKFEARSASCATEFSNSAKAYMCKYLLQYSYTVADKNYVNDRVAFIGKPLYQVLKKQLDHDKTQMVFYQPDLPSNSVLLAGDVYYHGGKLVVLFELLLGLFVICGLLWLGTNLIFNRIQLKTIF